MPEYEVNQRTREETESLERQSMPWKPFVNTCRFSLLANDCNFIHSLSLEAAEGQRREELKRERDS